MKWKVEIRQVQSSYEIVFFSVQLMFSYNMIVKKIPRKKLTMRMFQDLAGKRLLHPRHYFPGKHFLIARYDI